MPMTTATLTSKGQITIPKEVRERLGVEAGDRLEFVEEEKGVYKVVAATKDVRHLKGIVSKPGRAVSVEEMNRAVRKSGGRR
jgi:antitoxin PrlF